MLKADGTSKRFYKAAGVQKVETDDFRTGSRRTAWSLTLDGRDVRTPANKLLTLPTEDMAMAVALEFEIQDLTILPYTMPITSLAVSAIDQLARSDVRKSAINDLGRVLRTDLVTFRSTDEDLKKVEDEVWGPLCEWAEKRYKTKVRTDLDFTGTEQPDELLQAVVSDVSGVSDWRLTALDQVSRVTGSCLVSIALGFGFYDGDQALTAARLQEQYQADRYGRVEASGLGGHDVDHSDMRTRLAACWTFHRLLPRDK